MMFLNKRRKSGLSAFLYLFLLASVLGFMFTGELQAACPICGSQSQCDLSITNYNSRLARVTGIQTVNIIRVTMSGKTTYSMSVLKSNVNSMNDFYQRASYGRLA